jgi:multiple sugar transport system substrate-binding protein
VLTGTDAQNKANPYFGGQQVGPVLAEASTIVASGWQYPPFFEWARTIYGDIASKYYTTGKVPLAQILEEWKQRMVKYGNDQGFQVD